jgi:hypothetical protein
MMPEVVPLPRIDGFNPFTHRFDRDLRNGTAAEFLKSLDQQAPRLPAGLTARRFDERLPAPCRAYMAAHRAAYAEVIRLLTARQSVPRGERVAVPLWNAGLFFECHEWLERFWRIARGGRRQALQGWILAAGAFSHLAANKRRSGASLAGKAASKLTAHADQLAFVRCWETIIDGLMVDPPVPYRIDFD